MGIVWRENLLHLSRFNTKQLVQYMGSFQSWVKKNLFTSKDGESAAANIKTALQSLLQLMKRILEFWSTALQSLNENLMTAGALFGCRQSNLIEPHPHSPAEAD